MRAPLSKHKLGQVSNRSVSHLNSTVVLRHIPIGRRKIFFASSNQWRHLSTLLRHSSASVLNQPHLAPDRVLETSVKLDSTSHAVPRHRAAAALCSGYSQWALPPGFWDLPNQHNCEALDRSGTIVSSSTDDIPMTITRLCVKSI